MKQIMAFAAAALLTACAEHAPPEELSEGAEARIAAALADYRQTGEPVSCVNSRDLRGNRSIGEDAIVFEGTGRRAWVNRPPAGCPALTSGRALQIRTTSTQFCRGDIVTVFDPTSGIEYGGCGLGDFTPYERKSTLTSCGTTDAAAGTLGRVRATE
jgi:hypothetical protein